MGFSVRLFILVMGFLVFMIIFELVRKRRFREELSLIWLVIGVGLIFSSFADRIIDPLAFKLGIKYPPALIFLIVFFLLTLTTLYFSIVLSDLKSKNKELIQKIALLEYRVNKLGQAEGRTGSINSGNRDL
ncbi:MAG: DUF2304 domain-containing protein [Nitrospirota bacterium]